MILPVNDDINSQVGVVPDMLSGRVRVAGGGPFRG